MKKPSRGKMLGILAVWTLVIVLFFGAVVGNKFGVAQKAKYSALPEGYVLRAASIIEQTFYAQEERLAHIDLGVGNIPVEGGTVTVQITHGDRMIFESVQSIAFSQTTSILSVKTNLPCNIGDEYTVTLKLSPTVSLAFIDDDAVQQTVMVDGTEIEGSAVLQYRYTLPLTAMEKLAYAVSALIWGTVGTAAILGWFWIIDTVKKYANLLRQATVNGWQNPILLVLALAVVLLCTWFTLQNTLQGTAGEEVLVFFLLAVSLCVFLWPASAACLRRQSACQWWSAVAAVLTGYGAFSVVGKKILLRWQTQNFQVGDLKDFLLCCVWMLPVSVVLLAGFVRGFHDKKEKKMPVWVSALCMLLIIVPAVYTLLAFNPAITTSDSATCMALAHNIHGMKNWHTPFYVMCLSVFLTIWDSAQCIVLVQILLFALIWRRACALFSKLGVSLPVIVGISALLGSSQSTSMLLCTIWKDIPYGIVLLAAVVLVAEWALFPQQRKIRECLFYIELGIVMALVGLLRQNGIVVTVLLILTVLLTRRAGKKRFLAGALCVVIMAVVYGPLYAHFEIRPMDKGGAYIAPVHDMLGVYHAGGNLSEDTMELLTQVSDGKLQSGQYVSFRFWDAYLKYDGGVGNVLKAYIDTFFRNPLLLTQQVILRSEPVWNMVDASGMRLPGFSGWAGAVDEPVWYKWYPERVENSFTAGMLQRVNRSVELLPAMFVWRIGVFTFIALTCFGALLIKRHEVKPFLMFVPWVGQLLSLLLSTAWNDQRYFWPLQLMSIVIAIVTLAVNSSKPTLEKEEERNREF